MLWERIPLRARGLGVGVCGEVSHAGVGGGAVPMAHAGGDEDVHAAVAVVVAVGAGGEGDDVGLREVVDGVVRDDVVAVGYGVNFLSHNDEAYEYEKFFLHGFFVGMSLEFVLVEPRGHEVGYLGVVHFLEHEVAVAAYAAVGQVDDFGIAAVLVVLRGEVAAHFQYGLPEAGRLDVGRAVFDVVAEEEEDGHFGFEEFPVFRRADGGRAAGFYGHDGGDVARVGLPAYAAALRVGDVDGFPAGHLPDVVEDGAQGLAEELFIVVARVGRHLAEELPLCLFAGGEL